MRLKSIQRNCYRHSQNFLSRPDSVIVNVAATQNEPNTFSKTLRIISILFVICIGWVGPVDAYIDEDFILSVSPDPGINNELTIKINSNDKLRKKAIEYYFGDKAVKNRIEAKKLFEEAASNGDQLAILWLGCFIESDPFKRRNMANKVIDGIVKLAESGHGEAAYLLSETGSKQIFGMGHKINSHRAIWMEKAANLGNTNAMVRLGYNYHRGWGSFDRDYKKSITWYKKAAIMGNTNAMCKYAFTSGEPLKWLNRAADMGDTDAMVKIGHLFQEGYHDRSNKIKVDKDHRESIEWYRKAADLGDANGMYRLGYCYQSGSGVSR